MERNKINANKIPTFLSEKIYDALVKICGATDDFYEKETFVYHHSIVNNTLEKYTIKGFNNSIWEININGTDNYVTCKTYRKTSTEVLINKVIKHILQNKKKFSFNS